jgi:hypothetical protein
MWTAILIVALAWITVKLVLRSEGRAEQQQEQRRLEWINHHSQWVNYWQQEAQNAELPEYRNYCYEQMTYWHNTRPQ